MANNLTFNDGNLSLKNITEYPNSFKRQGAFPLERFSVFNTKAALEAYAQSNPVAYVGQILALVNEATNTTTIYSIQDAAGNLAEVGKATVGDDKSIVLDAETCKLSLNDYGVQYYEYDTNTSSYKSSPKAGWKAGLIPQVVADGESTKLAWFEPNPTTVEGLHSNITAIGTEIDNIKNDIGNDTTENSIKYRIKNLEDNKANASDVYTKTQTDTQISNAISGLGSVFELKAVMSESDFNALSGAVPEGYEAGDVVLVTITGPSGDTNKEYVVVNNGSSKKFELLGDPSGVTNLSSKLTTAEGEIDDLQTDVTKLGERITTAEGEIDTLQSDLGPDDNSGVRKRVTDLETTVNNTESGLVKKVADNTTAISKINGEIGSDTTKDSIKYRIKTNETAIGTINDKLNTVAEGAQVNKLEAVALGDGVTGTVTPPTADNGKTATINITKVDNAGTADIAKATEKTLTLFGKTFNGSTDVTVTADDDIGVATAAKKGLVKSSSGTDKVSVAEDGTMSVSKVSSAVNADSAAKVANALTFGSKTFDGSSAQEITLTDLGFNPSAYATADQGLKANSAVQTITIAGVQATKGENGSAVVAVDDLQTGLGLGTAAYKADTYFATATALSTLDGDVVKKTGDQTIDGNKTFNKAVSVATPTADGHATTKKYVDDEIAKNMSAIDAMTFKGLLGEGEGNVSTLPTTGVKNGDTYKVVTAGTYAEQTANVGDMFIALVKNTSESETSLVWTLIPSGDENNGNVMTGETLTKDQLIVGNGSQNVKVLAAGTNGQHLEMVGGKPTWADPNHTTIASKDESLSVTAGASSTYNVEVAKVNANLLFQTSSEYLILDGGSSTVNI